MYATQEKASVNVLASFDDYQVIRRRGDVVMRSRKMRERFSRVTSSVAMAAMSRAQKASES